MTIGELKEYIDDVPDDVDVCFCTNGENPYNDFWTTAKVIRICSFDGEFDRVVLMAK